MPAKSESPATIEPLAYSVSEAGKAHNVGRTYLHQLINENRLEARKIGKCGLISAHSLRTLIKSRAD